MIKSSEVALKGDCGFVVVHDVSASDIRSADLVEMLPDNMARLLCRGRETARFCAGSLWGGSSLLVVDRSGTGAELPSVMA